jgi:hypothetical protein
MKRLADLYRLVLETASLDKYSLSRIQTDSGENDAPELMTIIIDAENKIKAETQKGTADTFRLEITGEKAKRFANDLQYRTDIKSQPPVLHYNIAE